MSKVELNVGPNLYSSWPRALPSIKNCYKFIYFYFFHFFIGKNLTNLRAFKKMDLSIIFFKMPHPPNSGRKISWLTCSSTQKNPRKF
jgi:hypothetical protein